MDIIEILQEIRNASGDARTVGLPDAVVRRFAATDPSLLRAVHATGKSICNGGACGFECNAV